MSSMVCQHKEQLDAIKKNIDSLEREIDILLGINDNYGEVVKVKEFEKPKMSDVLTLLTLLKGGKQ